VISQKLEVQMMVEVRVEEVLDGDDHAGGDDVSSHYAPRVEVAVDMDVEVVEVERAWN
jgi:hypothetical protein